jgi:hypothetical protein
MRYMNHEESVVTAFFLPNRRERYLEIVRDPKKRHKLINELSHFKKLNPQFIVPITPNQQHVPQLMSLLRSKDAPAKCRVISEDGNLDSREIDLQEALKEVVGRQMGTILSCIPGKLAYFEDEDGRCLLER